MDMILVKKKRIALAEANSVGRQQYGLLDQSSAKNRGFWTNILSSVGSIANPLGHGAESKYIWKFWQQAGLYCTVMLSVDAS